MRTHVNRIMSVQALDAMRLEIEYQSGLCVVVDCADLPQRFAVFTPLRDATFFRKVVVANWGHSIEWPNGEGLDADRLMEMALEQSARNDTLAFRHWQDKHGLSLAQAAAALGVSRRTASQYRTGTRPVPRAVLLALRGWELETTKSIAA